MVIGVHAPEFAFEREPANVRKAVEDLGIRYPVALDNKYNLWTALKNNYWPAHYFIDAKGRVRFHHGEAAIGCRAGIRQLLADAGRAPLTAAMARRSRGAIRGAAPSPSQAPETYIGYWRAVGSSPWGPSVIPPGSTRLRR